MKNTKQNNTSGHLLFLRNVLLYLFLFIANVACRDQYCPCFNTTVKGNYKVEVLSDDVSYVGEGPYFDGKNGFLYYVDYLFAEFNRLDIKSGEIEKVFISKTNQTVSIILPYGDDPNEFIVTENNQILKLNWETKKTDVLATLPGTTCSTKFNGAKADSKGRLYIGAFDKFPNSTTIPGTGRLYRWTGGENFDLMADGFQIPSGIAFSADEELMYLSDYQDKKIYLFDHSKKTGDLTHKRRLVSFMSNKNPLSPYQGPAGMHLNQFGFLFTAFGSKLLKIDPTLGCISDQMELGANIATSVAYGSYKGNTGYFITTATSNVPTKLLKPNDGKILHVAFLGGYVYGFQP